jgi:hypothetical protein
VARADAHDVALDYVRTHLPGIDFDTLAAPETTTAGGVTTVRWRPSIDGIPAGDHELRVNVAGDRVLNVADEPVAAAGIDTTPTLTAGEAVRRVQDALGAVRSLPRTKGPAGATRATAYADGTRAALTLWGERLAWRVTYRESSDAVWDMVVDAGTGRVLRRANLVKSADVWENHPGTGPGGTPEPVDLSPWLSRDDQLRGPGVHAYADVDDDGIGAEVIPGDYEFRPVGDCGPLTPCSWTPPDTWQDSVSQSSVQAFYLANRFRDHLAGAPIGFTGIGGDDPLRLETFDGAAKHKRNNANMFTPPDGQSPIMQMYLWGTPNSGYRAVNGGDDASILFHEYTHGLSNRLIHDAAGWGALNLAQAGAMGEGWSDWYAKDFLVRQFPELDDITKPGDVDMGAYTDATPHTLRSEGLDCPVGPPSAGCPRGGYTYGSFGNVDTGPDVHFDGEIWAQTLWDLRTELGSLEAERVITAGMRVTPPEPSFLDARDAILAVAADSAQRDAMWRVFAKRGMGYFATTTGSDDPGPVEDFTPAPGLETPRGSIAGRVSDGSGAPVVGAKVALGSLVTRTGPDGDYRLDAVPAHAYGNLVFTAPGRDRATASATVLAGGTATVDMVLRRNWAAPSGGASVAGDDEYAVFGCGPVAALDQNPVTGWSPDADGARTMTIVLPEPVDVDHFEVDPAEACGDDAGAAAAGLLVETSPDGDTWTTAATPTFAAAARHRTNVVSPMAGRSGVAQVRVTITGTLAAGALYADLSEFGVYSEAPLPTPTPTPTASQTPLPTETPAPTETPTPTPVATAPPAATAAPPPAATATPSPAKPRFTLARSGRRSIRVTARCAVACPVTATLTVDAKTARKLRTGKKTLATVKRTLKPGSTTFTVKARFTRVTRITATLTVRSGSVVARRRVTIRR